MADRTKITELWVCVGDDGTGTGEGILSMLRMLTERHAMQLGVPLNYAGAGVSVLMLAYERETMNIIVREARKMNKPFRVIHFELPQDVTAEFSE